MTVFQGHIFGSPEMYLEVDKHFTSAVCHSYSAELVSIKVEEVYKMMSHSDVRRHLGKYWEDILRILNTNLKQLTELEHKNFVVEKPHYEVVNENFDQK